MGNFISNFQTTEELAVFSASTEFAKPHVSLTKDNNSLHFFKEIPPMYRWVDDGYTCVEYDKYQRQKQQLSLDGGVSWEDTGVVSATTLIEANSEYCGYIPPETRVVATFETYSDEQWIELVGYGSSTDNIELMEIDGVELDEPVTNYTFDTAGEHIVKYTLIDDTEMFSFEYNYYVKDVTIPDSVTTIGFNTFQNCSSLSSCTIGSGVTSIGDYAFYQCTSLTSIVIPDSVTSIGEWAFNGCSGLTSCTIGSGVTSIDEWAFNGCSGLTSIDIPDSVTSIGDYAFNSCSGLTSIDIPDSVTSIGSYAFYECSNLTSISIEAVTPPTLGAGVFNDTNDCPIYTPNCNYKTSDWSQYASRIVCSGGSGSGSGSGNGS